MRKKKSEMRIKTDYIKRIMRADEHIGRVLVPIPVIISKALELFLQDLCDGTHEVFLKKGGNAVYRPHIKECVHNHHMLEFLKEKVACVADNEIKAGRGSSAGRASGAGRRRKAAEIEKHGDRGNDVNKQSRSEFSNDMGRGRGRSRGERIDKEKSRNADNGDKRGADKSHETYTRCPKKSNLNVELNKNEVAGKSVEDCLQSWGTGLFSSHTLNIFEGEDDYDAEDE